MTDGAKIERLFGIVTLSFFATYSWGLILSATTNLTVAEKRKSVFRLGLESLMELFDRRQIPPPPGYAPVGIKQDIELSPHQILTTNLTLRIS